MNQVPQSVIEALHEAISLAYHKASKGRRYRGGVTLLRGNMSTTKPMPVTGANPSEDKIQAAFFQWLSAHDGKYEDLQLFYAIPNGAHKSPQARGLFKRTGLKAGVLDVHLPVESEEWNDTFREARFKGLWIEFKSAKGRLSPEQKFWIAALRLKGHRVEVCRSWTEAANVTIDYLGLPLNKL